MAKNKTLAPADVQNPDGLSKDLVHAISTYLGRLDGPDAPTATRAVRLVVDGGDDEVLLTLGGMKQAAEKLLLTHSQTGASWQLMQQGVREREKIFRQAAKAPPGVSMRMAQVLDAVSRASGVAAQAPPPGWPTWLVMLVSQILAAWYGEHRGQGGAAVWDLSDLEKLIQGAGLPADLIARAFLEGPMQRALQVGMYYFHDVQGAFSGWNGYLSRHLGVVRESMARPDAEVRLHCLQTLGRAGFDFTPVVDLLVQYGTGPAKTVREAALGVLVDFREAARPLIERTLAEGDASERHEAAQLLWRLFERGAADALRAHAAGESSERVKQTIDKLLAAPEEKEGDAAADLAAALPPVRVELGEVALSEEARAGWREAFDQAWRQAMQNYEKAMEQWKSSEGPYRRSQPAKPEPPSEAALQRLFRFVEGKGDKTESVDALRPYSWAPLGDWCAPPGVQLIHLVRHAFACGWLHLGGHHGDQAWWPQLQQLEAYRGRCKEPFGLRELDAAVASLPGAEPGVVARTYLARNNSWSPFCDWEAEAVWPIFAERPELLRDVLGPAPSQARGRASYDYWHGEQRRNAFKVLSMFPRLPPGFIPLLWDLALSESKGERPEAQAALATVPDKAARILVALGDGRQAVRAAAAEWLGRIGDPSAVEPLKEAFRREKQEMVKGAMMTALDTLGADVNEFLDRDTLLKEAVAGLAKKRPKGMDWAPLDRLPQLHWEDTGAPVDPRIPQWWLVQGVQQKSPACGPLLRRYLGMCRKHEAAALARFVLSAWIARDTSARSQEEAAELARKESDKMWAQWGGHHYYAQMYPGGKEDLYRQLFQKYSAECMGSAIGEKGMLSIAAAAGGADCVKLCEQFIRKWFGNRLAQCKCLVEVLAWMKHPLAIQALLAFANRFRTKAVRKLAEEHVQALADREGWTLDELADRTIPDGGFERPVDESGAPVVGSEAALALDYGPRSFTVKLDDELQPVVVAEGGKTVKNPPAPGKQDDAEKAKAAKKAFSDAKKMVKEVVKRQGERLYEALCTQRAWRFEDWRRFLAEHPIVGKLCVRLAWSASRVEKGPDGEPAETFLGCFRPLEDGSLTNEQDEQVKLDADARVRLAHTCNTSADLGAAWLKHFEDYDVTPPFEQFGRAVYVLPEEKKKETDVKDFEGHVLTTFKLRGRATKLGYIRGDAEDGGWFHLYRKPFPSLRLQAVVGFTGSSLPETDMPAALVELYFLTMKGDQEAVHSWQPSKLPLGKVPPVLLSECYNDVKQMAAEGSGYDPEWRKKSFY
jgi:hypothetical protein